MAGAALVAIMGAGRNGSTLISRLLDGSPDLWVHPIDVVFLPVWDDFAAFGLVRGESHRTATTRPLCHLDCSLEWSVAARLYAPQVEEIERDYLPQLVEPFPLRREALAALDRQGTTSPREFFPAFLAAARDAAARTLEHTPRLLVFKTSETAYIDDFVRIWPDLRFIHIVRNPIANYGSAKRTWIEKKGNPFWTRGEDLLRVFLEARWLPHARAILRYREVDPARHLLIRYEDLVIDPENEVLRLCDELGIRPPNEPTLQTALGGEHFRRFLSNPSKPGVETPHSVVADMSERFGYAEVVTDREAQLVARATRPLATALGYVDLPRVSGRVALWLRWLPVDASERKNATDRKRLAIELVKRRAYVTRSLISS